MARRWTLVLLLLASTGAAHAAARHVRLVVTRPYLNMRLGPGRDYPVFYVVARGETLTVLFSRTDWYKVRAPRGAEGWVRRGALAQTKLPSGAPAPIPPYPDFASHRWEIGAGYGVYNRQNLVTAYVDRALTRSLDAELVLQQAFGTLDNRYIATIGLRHTFIPEWRRFSPTAGLGTGYQYTQAKVPPKPLETSNRLAYVSVGARGFITRRFMWRIDWRSYVVFTHQNSNEEPEEWKFALAAFF
ncbi:MAG TPA: SH3 domain-containing protein [Steroidobacteraceae bacterium]|nr:SH3 domain-containing protein [Steroidobacteraceae bacterium]